MSCFPLTEVLIMSAISFIGGTIKEIYQKSALGKEPSDPGLLDIKAITVALYALGALALAFSAFAAIGSVVLVISASTAAIVPYALLIAALFATVIAHDTLIIAGNLQSAIEKGSDLEGRNGVL